MEIKKYNKIIILTKFLIDNWDIKRNNKKEMTNTLLFIMLILKFSKASYEELLICILYLIRVRYRIKRYLINKKKYSYLFLLCGRRMFLISLIVSKKILTIIILRILFGQINLE